VDKQPNPRGFAPRLLTPVLSVAILALAAFAIYKMSGEVHLDQVRAAIAGTSWSAIAWASALTLLSFAAISLYDVLAAHRVAPKRIPVALAAFAGAIGHAIANVVGSDVLVGGPVRYRIYAAAEIDAADVARIVGINLATFWLGLAALIGAALAFDPIGMPILDRLAPAADRALGVAIVAAIAAVVVWLWRAEREVSFMGWALPLPHRMSALLQVAVGAIDIAAAAAALYVLLPADVQPGFAAFLVLFALAIIVGTVSHVPAGLGVLEATILIGLGAGERPDVIAALLVFRVIYYVVPLVMAGAAFSLFEVWQARKGLSAASQSTLRALRPLAPTLLATLVLFGGAVLLLSSSLPAEGSRVAVLRHILPLPFSEGSLMLASLVGLVLIVLARGLFLRIALARVAAIVLLLAGAAFSIAKGLDWEEAVVLVAIAGALALFRDSFYRRGDWRSFRPSPAWIALIAITLISITFVGMFAFRDVDYRTDLWWTFAWYGDAPRFLRVTMVLAIAAAVIAVDALINRPVPPRPRQAPVPDAVRRILSHCPTTQPLLALQGDKRFLLDDAGTAFLMYGIARRSWVALGDPVGEGAAGRELLWRFAELADKSGGRPVYFDVTPKFLPDYLDLGLSMLKLGELARVDLSTFSLNGPAQRDLRYADRRVARDGLVFAVLPRNDVARVIPELRAVSDAWLATKVGNEMGFSLGRFEPDYLCEFDCAVLQKDGAIVAFANVLRGADREEFAPDLMRYRPGVSKVIMEGLFIRLLLYAQAEGYRWFNMGGTPLAGLSEHPLASTWNRLGSFVYHHVEEFYSFEGLRAFKMQFSPVWTPQYIACRAGLALPQILLDISSLTSGGAIGLVRRGRGTG
jgi:phosphatidylglycerol lysyltransferase